MLVTGHGIRVIARVHTAEGMKDADRLNGEEKRKLGDRLLTLWLNEIYRGRAVFTEPGPSAAETDPVSAAKNGHSPKDPASF